MTGELPRRAIELVVEGEAVDQARVARLGRDERSLARDLAHVLFAQVAIERSLRTNTASCCRSMSMWSLAATGPACSLVNCSGALL